MDLRKCRALRQALLVLTAFFIFNSIKTYAALPNAVDGQALPTLAPMLEKAMPAVVNISTRTDVTVRQNPLMQDPFFRHFFNLPAQPTKRQRHSLGSGVIVDAADGLILTNNHVIDQADEIMVMLRDGRQLSAELVGADPDSDIAVIRIEADNLVQIPVADSDQLRVGDFAVAIGNPFGLGQTVTSGIISALGRSGLGIEGYEDFIQTDASINPGNSGGALVNLRGELIGINTAILAPTGGNVGIGFAIPANMAISLKTTLVEHGEVRRGMLGIQAQDLTPELASAFDMKVFQGAVVTQINKDSPAELAGVLPGDIILEMNGRAVKNASDIRNAVGLLEVGDKVTLKLLRGGQHVTVDAEVAASATAEIIGESMHPALHGVTLSETAQDQPAGVLIIAVEEQSKAGKLGLQPGDIIRAVNRYRIGNADDMMEVISRTRGSALLLNIQRGNNAFFVILR